MAQKKPKKKLEVKNVELSLLANDLTQLLKEKLKLVAKIDALELLEKIESPLKLYEKVRLEFFKKHGKGNEKDGYTLPDNLDEKLKKELEDLNNKVVQIDTSLNIEQIKYIESEYPYVWLLRFLTKKK